MTLQLAYCGLNLADCAAWERFAVDGLGLMRADGASVCRLRTDSKSWRFALHSGAEDDISYVGFECDSLVDLETRRKALTQEGLQCTAISADELVDRQVTAGFYVRDPDGLRIELIVGHAEAKTGFSSSLVQGFLTGDQGLGHVVLTVKNLDAGIRFYQKLSFALSDFITVPMGPNQLRIAFMHCNPRHHSLAIAQLPSPKRLNHIMIEVNQVDDVLLGYRRCIEQKYPTGGVGRHPNDQMLSFYVQTPGGFDLEYGWGGRKITDNWDVVEYDQISIWGHERPNAT